MPRRDLSAEKKLAIIIEAEKYRDMVTGKLIRGAVAHILHKFAPLSKTTLMRVVREYKAQQMAGNLTPCVAVGRKDHCGRKSKLSDELRAEYTRIVQDYANRWIRLSRRTLQEELRAAGFPLATRTINRHLKALHCRAANLRIKPTLSVQQKEDRLRYVLSQVRRAHGDHQEHRFKDLMDTVMVDESWFFVKRVNNQVLLIEGTVIPPAPTCQHKSHIE